MIIIQVMQKLNATYTHTCIGDYVMINIPLCNSPIEFDTKVSVYKIHFDKISI